jgi:hypothetical protein
MSEQTNPQLRWDSNKSFVWHLRSPFVKRFHYTHWWPEDASDVPIEAALWEMLRRHPEAVQLARFSRAKAKLGRAQNSPNEAKRQRALQLFNLVSCGELGFFEWFIVDHWSKSWQELSLPKKGEPGQPPRPGERREWLDALVKIPPQRGFDPRPLYSITAQSVDWKRGANPNAALIADVQEQEIARLSIEHHRAGRVVVAVDPYVSNVKAAGVAFGRLLKAHRDPETKPADHGKERIANWLAVIREFENAETEWKTEEKRSDRYHQLAVRYRRIVGSLDWPSRRTSDKDGVPTTSQDIQ